MTDPHFDMHLKPNGGWFWKLVGPDGSPLATGDWNYKTEADCYIAIMAFKQIAQDAEIVSKE